MKRIFAPSIATALVAIMALAVSGPSWAEDTENGMSEMSGSHSLSQEQEKAFSQLDANKDGKISPEEAKQNEDLNDQFGKADTNQDNAIDEGEFARFEMENEQNKVQDK